MADTKMSALPVAGALAGADIFAIAQGGVSKQASATQIATFVGGASAPPFDDGTAIVKGSADATKLLRFEVDGFTAGATRILTPPNANATIAGLQIAQTFSEVQTFSPGNNLIPVVIAAASVTGAGTSPFLDISGTWNTTGAPDAIRLTVTDTASNSAANLLDLMIGAASLFAIRKDGRATIAADALIAGAASPAITSIRVSVGAAAAQNVIRINGNSTADNAPVLDFLRSGNREWTFAPISNSFFISNSGGVANFNDATLNATPNWEFTSLGALKLNLGTATTGLLHISTNTTAAGLTIFEQASADTDDYDLSFRKTRGTVAAPTVITSGDSLGTIMFRGYSGAGGYVTAANIRGISTGTIASTRVPASLVFATGTDATPSVLTDRLTIDNAGNVTQATATSISYTIRSSAGSAAAIYDRFAVGNSARVRLDTASVEKWNFGMIGAGASVNTAFSIVEGAADVGTARMVVQVGGQTNFQSDIFEIRRTTTAQISRVYETADAGQAAPTNFSRTTFTTQAGNHLIRTESGGTGTLRILQVGTGPSTGTDIAGVSTILHGGQATGSGAAGAILFQQSLPVGGSGAAVTALATTASFTTTGLFSTLFSSLIRNATAIPAGGTAGSGYMFSSTSNFGIFFGSGAPSLVAAKGSLYLRSDGSGTGDRCYVATDSAGAWAAITTAT